MYTFDTIELNHVLAYAIDQLYNTRQRVYE